MWIALKGWIANVGVSNLCVNNRSKLSGSRMLFIGPREGKRERELGDWWMGWECAGWLLRGICVIFGPLAIICWVILIVFHWKYCRLCFWLAIQPKFNWYTHLNIFYSSFISFLHLFHYLCTLHSLSFSPQFISPFPC